MKAQAVAQAMARGLARVSPHFELTPYPLASGGSGTAALAARLGGGRVRHELIPVPNRRPRDVKWVWLPDGSALFDAVDALGAPDGPSALETTYTHSVSLGMMIQRLLKWEPQRIAISLGDVLAADGGLGLLEAFGVVGVGPDGERLAAGSRQLLALHHLNFDDFKPPEVPLVALTDGKASWQERVQQADFRLDLVHGGLARASCRYAELLGEHVSLPLAEMPGTGVGGGLGMALGFLGAQFLPGAEYLARLGHLADFLGDVDWILTGSAHISVRSQEQAVGVVARLAREAGIPAVALAVTLGRGHQELYDDGLTGLYPVLDRPRQERDAQRSLAPLIEKASFRVGYWMQALSDL